MPCPRDLPGLPRVDVCGKRRAILNPFKSYMKSGFKKVVALGLTVVAVQSVLKAEDTNTTLDATNKLSYSIGMNVGMGLKANLTRAGFEVNPEVVSEAIRDVLTGKSPKLTEQQAQEIITAYQQELRAKREQERIQLAAKNHAAAEKFLSANKSKPDVKTKDVKLPDGNTAELQYKVVSEGSGDSPKPEDTVTFKFRTTTLDGKEVDSSEKRGQPAKTVLAHYPIVGVKEALQSMTPGAKWELFIPPALAFGDNGAGQNVEPGSALIYEVELLSVDVPQPPQPLTSDIIKVPSKEELDRGAKIEVIKSEDVKKMQQTNPPGSTPGKK